MSESETPRTDKLVGDYSPLREDAEEWPSIRLARNLERELSRLREECNKALAAVRDADVNVVAGGGAIFHRWIKWHEKHAEIIALANKEKR